MRLRRVAKWFTTTAAAFLLVAFVASVRYQVTVRSPGAWRVEVSGGSARVSVSRVTGSRPPGPLEVDAGRHTAPMAWWPRRYRRVGWPAADIPLWLLAVVLTAPAAWLWRLDRRTPAGHCRRCGYDLRTLPSDAGCPECGAPIAPSGVELAAGR